MFRFKEFVDDMDSSISRNHIRVKNWLSVHKEFHDAFMRFMRTWDGERNGELLNMSVERMVCKESG
jgi:hypothetical protein